MPQTLPVFQRNATCTSCTLHKNSRNPCVSARPLNDKVTHTTALLIVGDYPGHLEDTKCSSFVGATGQLLTRVYVSPGARSPSLWDFTAHADVYVTNAVRCRTARDGEVPAVSIRACRPYLHSDLAQLQSTYSDVIVLCVGTAATKSVLGCKLTKAFSRQGTTIQWDNLRAFRVFCTYNPAILFKRKNPAKSHAILDHLLLVRDYLQTGISWRIPADFPSPTPRLLPPSYPVSRIAFDIETYGSVRNLPEQTHFHPHRSVHLDGCPPDQLIQTACVGYRDSSGTLVTGSFVWSSAKDRAALRKWFEYAREYQIPVVGMNIKFDMQYVRYCERSWALSLLADDSFPLEDVGGWNYLQNETRPEHGLKPLAYLFGITEYRRTLKEGKFADAWDRNLHRYNAEDCLASIVACEMLTKRIADDFGPDHAKLSPATRDWYSQLIWMCITLMETGIAIDIDYLNELHRDTTKQQVAILRAYTRKFGKPLAGPQSKTTLRELALDAFSRSGAGNHPDLKKTKTGEVSLDRRNRNIFTIALKVKKASGAGDFDPNLLSRLQRLNLYKQAEKLRSSYIEPFLGLSIGGLVYPQWYPFPGSRNKHDDDNSLGTKGCRITCSEPACQTVPRRMKDVYRSRFGGFLISADQSQVELRTVALLSWDPTYVRAYADDLDLHRETAIVAFGPDCVNHRDYDEVYRQGGKRTNFLMIYRGGADRLRQVYQEWLSLDYTQEQCATIISDYFKKYAGLEAYHQELIRFALKHGYIEVPMLGATRWMGGCPKVMLETYESTIVNVPIQATAANIQISAQKAIMRELKKRNFRSVCCFQQFDSLFVDGPSYEFEPACELVRRLMENPPYYQKLCDLLGRRVPLKADIKVRWG